MIHQASPGFTHWAFQVWSLNKQTKTENHWAPIPRFSTAVNGLWATQSLMDMTSIKSIFSFVKCTERLWTYFLQEGKKGYNSDWKNVNHFLVFAFWYLFNNWYIPCSDSENFSSFLFGLTPQTKTYLNKLHMCNKLNKLSLKSF